MVGLCILEGQLVLAAPAHVLACTVLHDAACLVQYGHLPDDMLAALPRLRIVGARENGPIAAMGRTAAHRRS